MEHCFRKILCFICLWNITNCTKYLVKMKDDAQGKTRKIGADYNAHMAKKDEQNSGSWETVEMTDDDIIHEDEEKEEANSFKCPASKQRTTPCIEGCPCHSCRNLKGAAMLVGESSCSYQKRCAFRVQGCQKYVQKLCSCPRSDFRPWGDCKLDKEICSSNKTFEDLKEYMDNKTKPLLVPCEEGCPCELCEDLKKTVSKNEPWYAIPGENFRNPIFSEYVMKYCLLLFLKFKFTE